MDCRILLLFVVVSIYVAAVTADSVTICEGQTDTLKCRKGQTIKIRKVMYGRKKKATCRDANATSKNCESVKAQKRVERKCNNENKCRLTAANDQLGGDPCPGVSKYLEVSWICK